MTPQERIETEKRIKQYLKENKISKVLHMQVERVFEENGVTVNIWNVKTNKGGWWVAEGLRVPMNLYTQDAYYFSVDVEISLKLAM